MRGNRRCTAFSSQSCLTCSATLALGVVGVGVLDELAAQRHDHARRPQQFGFQDVVEVQHLFAVALHQAVAAVPPVEADQPGGIEQQHRSAQQACGVQHLHAEQSLHALATPTLPAGQLHVADEVVEGVVNGQGSLLGLGQAVEVGQHLGAGVAQFEIELAAGAELEQIQVKPPPGEEACGVGTGVLARVCRGGSRARR